MTRSHLQFPTAFGNGPTISRPHWAHGHGLDRGLSTPPGWWMFGANLWHWSHFFTYSCVSFCILSYQYPWVRALCDNDLPPVWLPHIPSFNSSRSGSTASGWTQSNYGLEKECWYNFCSLDSQNRGGFLRIFSTSLFSLGKTPSLRNRTNGPIQLGSTMIWWTWTFSFLSLVGLCKSSTSMT